MECHLDKIHSTNDFRVLMIVLIVLFYDATYGSTVPYAPVLRFSIDAIIKRETSLAQPRVLFFKLLKQDILEFVLASGH